MIKKVKKQSKIIITRPYLSNSNEIAEKVKNIMLAVKENGDKALLDFSKKFDSKPIEKLFVTKQELEITAKKIDKDLKKAIDQAYKNIYKFHKAQLPKNEKVKISNGINCWRKSVQITSVGLYIPGGSAPLFSTVLMLGVPSKIANCEVRYICTPPSINGGLNPAIAYAALICGINKIYLTGGAQAIAAMTFGTETIPKVHKIFGPGNQYVTAAKMQALNYNVAIDMPAGPSEVLVIADETANANYVAADLLSQAEHGGDSQVVLLCTNTAMLKKINGCIKEQIKLLPRNEIATEALKNSHFLKVKNVEEAVEISNGYAPEHLIIQTKNALAVSKKIINAGSVFIGNYSPESLGDYASGTNHTLPTNGAAMAYSGVSLDSFYKKITYQQITKEGLMQIAKTVETMAEAEGLMAHKNAISVRLKK